MKKVHKIGLGMIGVFALLLGLSYTAVGEYNFWSDVSTKLTKMIFEEKIADAPDFTLPENIDVTLGAMPGSELHTEHFCVNGVCTYYMSQEFTRATTTFCSFPNPHHATSTLLDFGYQVRAGTSTLGNLTIATSTLRYATSTAFEIDADRELAQNSRTEIYWQAAGGPQDTFNYGTILANEYVGLYNASSTGLSTGIWYRGTCHATFRAFKQ